jgi:NTE family protein
MFRQIFIVIFLSLLCEISLFSQKVGLVLSGGGAKGAVHVGIIKALEENDIPIDYIAGTSIGAIVGSMYAMGYSPEEMVELFLSDDFHYWQTGKVQDEYQFFSYRQENRPNFVRFTVPLKDSLRIRRSDILPNTLALINPIQMNQAFVQLFSQANAQCKGDFNNLFVPFLCVSSDIFHKKAVVLRSGNLGDAVRASMTFPLVFKPIIKDSVPLYDGGIYDNFPVEPMKEAFHPDFIIGSSVAGMSQITASEMDVYRMIENIVMQRTVYDVKPEDGLMFSFVLDDVNLLDFNKAQELYDLGYKTTIERIDSIKQRIKRRVPYSEIDKRRKEYKNGLPQLLFRDIHITGLNESQMQYVESQIKRNESNVFNMEDLKQTYFRLLANPKIKEINPEAVWDEEDKTFDLYLDIKTQDEITISFGGNISSMSANQLYLGLGYQSLTELASSFNLDLQVGNAYTGVWLSGKIQLPTRVPMDITATFVHNYRKYYESEKLFIDTDISTFIHQRETFGKLTIGFPFFRKIKLEGTVGYGLLDDKYYQNTAGPYYADDFDRTKHGLFMTGLAYKLYSLDYKQYPTKGKNQHLYVNYYTGNENFEAAKRRMSTDQKSQSWLHIDGYLNHYHDISRLFKIGYEAQAVYSFKEYNLNYTASVLQAPSYTPTPHSKLVFNERFRANQFIAGGLIPILKLNSTVHLRGDFHGFMPLYPIKRDADGYAYSGDMFTNPAYMGELSLVFQLPFMSISMFGNYYSYPANNWNFGINIGYLIFGPKFIQ